MFYYYSHKRTLYTFITTLVHILFNNLFHFPYLSVTAIDSNNLFPSDIC